eukprot:TRINITY_DN29152_c0_g1_i1.p1 TRINITY_DN29152_c0_g1~~TRINITY_DN29152_c0_g1_i1.p1  ORF type:complete len:780 (+),score=121.34 TRINITY_DN29152_c0_g1_i1:89-2428(+)
MAAPSKTSSLRSLTITGGLLGILVCLWRSACFNAAVDVPRRGLGLPSGSASVEQPRELPGTDSGRSPSRSQLALSSLLPLAAAFALRRRKAQPRQVCRATSEAPEVVDIPSSYFDGDRKRNLSSLQDYESMYKASVDDPAAFWHKFTTSELFWSKEPTSDPSKVLQWSFDTTEDKNPTVSWFADGETNICYNALDRHVKDGKGSRVAFIAERNDPAENSTAPQPETYTYSEALAEVCRIANTLKELGVQKGDRVALFMPMVSELPLAMLACARIGAVHTVVFGGFSAESLSNRLVDAGSKVVITCDGVMRGSKPVKLYEIADAAAALSEEKGLAVQKMLVLERLGAEKMPLTFKPDRDVMWKEAVSSQSPECPVTFVNSEDPLFILYTSGSTGTPKGILHSTGGYMTGAYATFKYVFDVQPDSNDVWFCTADCGWITGHSYVAYGPTMVGATQIIFEGVPSYPDASRLWEIVQARNVTHLYTAPTAIRALMRLGEDFVTRCDRSSLRHLGSVGEPINPEAWRWYHEVVGESRCPIADTWWQTETGAISIAPLPAEGWQQKPGSATRPFFGIQPVLLDPQGNELEGNGVEGLLAIKHPWPSMLRGVWGNEQRFRETYFPISGYYLTGDGARRDEDGYYWITGRVDDVIIVSGHNIGTAEVESALVARSEVAEAAVVGVPNDLKGQSLYAYVTLKQGQEPSDDLRNSLRTHVRTALGPFCAPDTLHWAPALPKTRSGKIMRRILRKIAEKGPSVDPANDLGDTSTLAEPAVVEELIASHGK